MKRRIRTMLAIVAPALLSACATLDEGQCRTINWQQLGYADGSKGYAATRLAEHQDACKSYGIAPDTVGWRLGYAQGQGVFCTAPNGYQIGRRGEGYNAVCPAELDQAFRPAYEDGRGIAAQVGRLQETESRLRDIQNTLVDDDRRARAYVDAARHGDNQAPPELLDRRARNTLEREFDYLRDEYRGRMQSLAQADGERSEFYRVDALRLQPAY